MLPLRKTALLASMLFALVPAAASAGSFENGIYTSNLGYSVKPPEGWIRLDAATFKGAEVIPNNLRKTNFDRMDVVFYYSDSKNNSAIPVTLDSDRTRADARKAAIIAGELPAPGTPEAAEAAKTEAENARKNVPEAPKFAPSISIMVISDVPTSSTRDLAVGYAAKLKDSVSRTVPNAAEFKITKSTEDKIQGTNVLQFGMEYRVGGLEIKTEQTVFILSDRSVIVSCTSSDKDYIADSDWCTSTLKSFNL